LKDALVDEILNKHRKPDDWSTPSHRGFLHVRYLEVIEGFAEEIKGLEDWLKAWSQIENEVNMDDVAK
jgi:hypothetical protein